MEASTIATLSLVGLLLISAMIIIPEVLFLFSFLALLAGFCAILGAGWIGGWWLFGFLCWELFWIAIASFIPKQRELWTRPY